MSWLESMEKWWQELQVYPPSVRQFVDQEMVRLNVTPEEYYWAYCYCGEDHLVYAFRFLEFVREFYSVTWTSWLSGMQKDEPHKDLIAAGKLFSGTHPPTPSSDRDLCLNLPTRPQNDPNRRFLYQEEEVRYVGSIEIIGKSDYIGQVVSSLALLSNKAPEEFGLVLRYIGRIREWFQSGITVYEIPPVFFMSRKVAFSSLTWGAGCIAHEAWHSKLYHEYKASHPTEVVPGHIYHGQDIEMECNKIQISALRKMKAPESEIAWVGSLDGSHWNQGWGEEHLRPY